MLQVISFLVIILTLNFDLAVIEQNKLMIITKEYHED